LEQAETRLELLQEVEANLSRIIDDHASSDLAVQLLLGPVGPLNLVPSRFVWVWERRCVRRHTRFCSRDVRRVWRGDHTYRSVRRAGSVALRAMLRDGGSFEA
jgi:hypothetical protein